EDHLMLENNTKLPPFPDSIPAQLLWNLTTNSTLELTVHGHPVKLICKKNPLINNTEFHEQFNLRMNKFYNYPSSVICNNPTKELIPAGILIETILDSHTNIDADGDTTTITRCSYTWGPNGCSNEKKFALITAKDALAPYGNNLLN